MKHSTSKPTKLQQARLDALHAMPCIACAKEGEFASKRGELRLGQPGKTEIHHLVDKGYRIHSGGHDATLNLCRWHHRGICIEYVTAREMKELHGPSLALHKREFVALYGSERKLLAEVDEQLSKGIAA
jgi:hypothetical protein